MDYKSLLELHFELDSLLDQGLISQEPLPQNLRRVMSRALDFLPARGWVLVYEDHFCRPVVLTSPGVEVSETLEFMQVPRAPLREPLEVSGCRLGTLELLSDAPDAYLELGARALASRLDTHLFQHNAWSFEALKARGVQVMDALFDSDHRLKEKLQEGLSWLVDALDFRGGFLLLPTEGQLQVSCSSVQHATRVELPRLLAEAGRIWEDREGERVRPLLIGQEHFLAILLRPDPRPAEGLLLLYDDHEPSAPRVGLADYFTRLLDSALQSTRLYNRSFAGFLSAMGSVIDAFDPYTHGHSERVARYAVALGSELGLTQAELDLLWVAGVLHDVGKVGVATEILRKQGTLDPTQINQVREHAALTGRILQGMSVDDFEELALIASSHHEREDGTGYPLGLTGEQIPVLTKILSVADVFDAVTSDRPQHPGRTRDEGYAILRDEVEAGRLNDVVVSRFLQESVWERIRPDFEARELGAGPV